METEKKAMIVYRSCGSLDQYEPVVEETLTEKGYSIEKKVFPAGTPVEEIKAWTEEHLGEIEKAVVFYDDTVEGTLPEEAISKKRRKTGFSLDKLLSEVTLSAYASSPRVKELEIKLYELEHIPHAQILIEEHGDEYLSVIRELYGLCFKEKLSSETRAGMEMIIIEGTLERRCSSLLEHVCGSQFRIISSDIAFESGYYHKCAEAIKEGLEEAGIRCVIREVLEDITPEEIEKLELGKAYLFCDRHVIYCGYDDWVKGVFSKEYFQSRKDVPAFKLPYFEDFRRWPIETQKEEMLDDPVRLMKEKIVGYISISETKG
jgi:hypothetical protein